MDIVILFLFTGILFFIFLYSLSQLHLLIAYRRWRRKPHKQTFLPNPQHDEFPFVTVQLPIYNERPVVERLLHQVSQLDYPGQRLEIQVLDDSTDDSVHLIARIVAALQRKGVNIQHIRRPHRKGFKAGALKEGLRTAKGELIAIFDADFLPGKTWLLETVTHFNDPHVGVVQTRWGHLNRNYSILTRLQAFLLDFHFIFEQNARNAGRHFINFNGTAGIWRKKCILDAGNWQGDTLTEDLDLSYRAQLKAWKFKYLERVETPAELPITLSAARTQQFRWNKGAAQNFQKNFRSLLSDQDLPLQTKVHGCFHLLNSSLFLLILLLALMSVPLLLLSTEVTAGWLENILVFFSLSTLIFYLSYWMSYSKINGTSFGSLFKFSLIFFTFFSIALGFSLHNSIAVLEGHFGKKSEFIRTPKFNIRPNARYSDKSRLRLQLPFFLEFLLMLLFCWAFYKGIRMERYQLLLFHFMLIMGFSFMVLTTLHLAWKNNRHAKYQEE